MLEDDANGQPRGDDRGRPSIRMRQEGEAVVTEVELDPVHAHILEALLRMLALDQGPRTRIGLDDVSYIPGGARLTPAARAGVIRAFTAIQLLLPVLDRLLRRGSRPDVAQGLSRIAERACASTLGCAPEQNTWKQIELMLVLELAARCEPCDAEVGALLSFLGIIYPHADVSREELAEAIELFRRVGGRPRKGKRRWSSKWACFSELSERSRIGRIDEGDAKKLRQRLYRRFLGALPHQRKSGSR